MMDTTGFQQPPPQGATLVWHENCGYEAILDDFPGPQDSTKRIRKNAWIPEADYTGVEFVAHYRMDIQPSVANQQDRFLVVYEPTSTVVAKPSPASLIDSPDVYGAIVGPAEVAVFSKGTAPLRRAGYSIAHAGGCLHVVSGLASDTPFSVQQNGVARGTYRTGPQGALSFQETGGGAFVIEAAPPGAAQ